MPEDAGDRTEPATPRRRQEARTRGQVPKSQDLAPAVLLLAAMTALYWWGEKLTGGLLDAVRLGLSASDFPLADVQHYVWQLTVNPMSTMLWMVAWLIGVAVLVLYLQVGWMLTTKPLQPDLSRLNPLTGLKRLFSFRNSSNLVMGFGKLVCIVATAWLTINHDLPVIIHAMQLDFLNLVTVAVSLVLKLGFYLAIVLFLLAIIDYAIQKFQFERDLRMTKQEIRDELRNMEGDPNIKRRRRDVHRQLAFHQIKRAVPKADVVIANPTHFSIALQYDVEKMSAPKVVAKGADFLALRIRAIAQSSGVPVVERPTLARSMYDQVEVGEFIPEKFYQAVAEILAYVYEISGRAVNKLPGTPAMAVGA